MRVIVTGASGFIGRNMLLRMPRDWQVLALFHQSSDFEAFVTEHDLRHVTPVRCNLLTDDVRALARAVSGRADAALYLAANGDPAASVAHPRLDLESNAVALVNFLEHCPIDHFVFLSSGAVYDGLVGSVTPATPVNPRLPYAISKLASEQYVRFFAERRSGVASFINVRFFGAYGPYEPPRKTTSRWLLAAAAGDREFVVRGDGTNLIDFMYVDDAVDGLLALIRARGTTATVDFASGSPMTVNAVLDAMAHAFGADMTIRHHGTTAEDIRFRTSDATMRERFGVTPSIPFDAGVRQLATFLHLGPNVGHQP
jgi:nucleoside-diphosphate-sugar epimerase